MWSELSPDNQIRLRPCVTASRLTVDLSKYFSLITPPVSPSVLSQVKTKKKREVEAWGLPTSPVLWPVLDQEPT